MSLKAFGISSTPMPNEKKMEQQIYIMLDGITRYLMLIIIYFRTKNDLDMFH